MKHLDNLFADLKEQANLHLVSRQAVLDQKNKNFDIMLSRLTHDQKRFWFGNVNVQTLDDLQLVTPHKSADVVATQKQNPPFGINDPGQLLFMSSGSTGTERPRWYFSWQDWLLHNIGAGRSLMAHNVNHSDSVMTMDVGNSQNGYKHFEDAASMMCGAKIIKSGATTWSEKLSLVLDYDVTILVGTTTKLMRLASLVDDQYKSGLRLIVQIGEPITQDQIQTIKEKFKVSQVLDGYGSVEMGQVSYNCPHGNTHFHDDLVNLVNVDNVSLFTNLSGLPIINYILGENMYIDYQGPCACGSHLSQVTMFKNRNTPNNRKE